MRWRWSVGVVLLVLSGCTSTTDRPRAAASPGVPPSPSEVVAPSDEPSQSPSQGPSQRPTPSPSAPRSTDRRHRSVERADPRWRFYSTDPTRHTSPWYAGAHRVMIGYGCTVAPYYAHDPRCPGHQGFHHGIDVAMPCGTRLSSDLRGRVVDPVSPGAPGAAYGPYAFRIRSTGPHPVDVLIGHVRTVYVHPGDVVRPGQPIARANDLGAPDGCHLHFEVRHAGTGLSGAVDPAPYLQLSR